ncbi:MAG TPA: hypothetical protein VIK75_06535, partial [Calditerricola sp.]
TGSTSPRSGRTTAMCEESPSPAGRSTPTGSPKPEPRSPQALSDDLYIRLQRTGGSNTSLPSRYLAWRDRFIPRGVDLLEGLEALTDEELQRAWHELLPGVSAAKLNPKSPEFDGSFHLAAGVIMGVMHARKLNIPMKTWPLG